MKIKEIIIVEGKNDTQKLKRYFDCDTIETHGMHLSKKTLEMIRQAQKKRGVIIFTDPDAPGEKIRMRINQHVEGCKNAFIDKKKARTTKKVGIEHASEEDLKESLEHLLTYSENLQPTLSWSEFIELGCSGKADSSQRRRKLEEYLHIGKSNGKTLYKRLNMLQLNQQECLKILEDKQ